MYTVYECNWFIPSNFVRTPCCTPLSSFFKNNFIMNALMENSVWPWNLSTLENKSHEWLFPFLSRRSHYRLIELMISMKRIQKHSYHMLSPSKFMPFEANSPSSKTPQFVMHPCTCSCSLYIQANTASRYITSGVH